MIPEMKEPCPKTITDNTMIAQASHCVIIEILIFALCGYVIFD